MSEHTPGPWTWQRGEKWHRLHGKGPDGKPVTILRAAQNNGPVMTPARRSDQDLIAAAPDLLAALQRYVDAYQGYMDGRENASEIAAAELQARRAIAKTAPPPTGSLTSAGPSFLPRPSGGDA